MTAHADHLARPIAVLGVVAYAAAWVTPWTWNADCGYAGTLVDLVADIFGRGFSVTAIAAILGLLLVATSAISTFRKRVWALPAAVAALVVGICAVVTVDPGMCHWYDSLGGGASADTRGPGAVLIIVGPIVVLIAALIGRRRTAAVQEERR